MEFLESLLGGGGGGSKAFGNSEANSTLNFGDDSPKGPNWVAIAAIAGAVLTAIVVVIAVLKRKG